MIGQNNVTGLQHIGIPCSDIDVTVAFYTGLGFKTVMTTLNKAANEKVAFLRLGDTTIETYQVKSTAGVTGSIDHIAFSAKDVSRLYEEVKAGCYTILGDGIESLPFWEHGVKFFKILGPNNEVIEFSQIL